MRVEPQWVDHNGHLNMAWYHVLFDRAIDEAFGLVGLNPDYTATRGLSFFAAECHILYRRELASGDIVRITLHLIAHDEKRLHFHMEMHHATQGWIAAATENLALHVDMASRRVTPFPTDIRASLAVMQAAHDRLKRPENLGRVIGFAPRTKKHEPDPERNLAGADAESAPTRH